MYSITICKLFSLPRPEDRRIRRSLNSQDFHHGITHVNKGKFFDINSIRSMSTGQLVRICSSSKSSSLGFQEALVGADSLFIERVCALLSPQIGKLFQHPFASYSLEVLAEANRSFADTLASYASTNLILLAQNQFSSRTMQTLVRIHKTFRLLVLEQLGRKPETLTSQMSVVFLATSAVRYSEQ